MKIAVLVKQVPATENVRIDEKTGTMIRDGVEAEVNPPDLHAIEAAMRLKESHPQGVVKVCAITMGPPNAEKAVRQAIALGADGGLLLTDRKFGGSDTLATAVTIAQGIRVVGGADIILCGERATDGETGQVGAAVGHLLGFSIATYVSEICEIDVENQRAVVVRAIEGGHETIEVKLPMLCVVVKEINRPRLCTLGGKRRARDIEILELNAEQLGLPDNVIGLAGSPTKVVRVSYPQITRKAERLSAQEAMEKLINTCKEAMI